MPDLDLRKRTPAPLQPLLNAFPIPNGPNLANSLAQFAASYTTPTSLNAGSIRIDHNMKRWNLFGRFNEAPSDVSPRGQGGALALSNVVITELGSRTITGGATWLASRR